MTTITMGSWNNNVQARHVYICFEYFDSVEDHQEKEGVTTTTRCAAHHIAVIHFRGGAADRIHTQKRNSWYLFKRLLSKYYALKLTLRRRSLRHRAMTWSNSTLKTLWTSHPFPASLVLTRVWDSVSFLPARGLLLPSPPVPFSKCHRSSRPPCLEYPSYLAAEVCVYRLSLVKRHVQYNHGIRLITVTSTAFPTNRGRPTSRQLKDWKFRLTAWNARPSKYTRSLISSAFCHENSMHFRCEMHCPHAQNTGSLMTSYCQQVEVRSRRLLMSHTSRSLLKPTTCSLGGESSGTHPDPQVLLRGTIQRSSRGTHDHNLLDSKKDNKLYILLSSERPYYYTDRGGTFTNQHGREDGMWHSQSTALALGCTLLLTVSNLVQSVK